MTAPELLARLAPLGVVISLNTAGDGLTLTGTGRPPADLLEEVKSLKPALVAYLRGEEESENVGQPDPLPSSPPTVAHRPRPKGPDWQAISQQAGKCGSCARATPAPDWGPLMVVCSCPPIAFWPDPAPIALHVGHNCAAYRPEGQEVGEGYRSKASGKRWGPVPSQPVPSMTLEELKALEAGGAA